MKERIEYLVKTLNEASDAYYNGEAEILTNAEWDALFDELTKLEKESGIILPESPTQKVSEDATAGKKVEHRYPALSLAKTKDINELKKWAGDKDTWLSWKLDGLTLVATYSAVSTTESVLFSLVTRGNGLVGTDVTHLAPYIQGLPTKIPYGHNLIVRGEALIFYDDFEEVNSEGIFANPRNMAAGSMTLQDTEEFSKRRIHLVSFTLVHTTEDINSFGDRMDLLDKLGFETVERVRCTPDTIEKAKDEFTEKVQNGYKYPVDGLVLVYDDTSYASSGSVTGHHATRAGLAFKWADESVTSTLKYIDWSCSTNSITPVAVFEPVEILGTTVQRASLHNISECRRLGIGGKGTELSIIKANMIIPQVIQVTSKEGEFEIPRKCPVCHHETKITKSDSGTETLICTNPECVAKNISKFTRFASRNAMNIDGFSEATIRTFINKGFISSFTDIYSLNNYRDQISHMDGFGKKSADNLIKAIEKSKVVDADKFLYALSIPLCGRDVAKRIMTAYTFDDFIKVLKENDDESFLSHIEGIGAEKSKAVSDWAKTHLELLERLAEILTINDIRKGEGKCTGYTFVITGDVHNFRNRDELKAYIEQNGGKVAGSVSKKTSYLINNDINSTSGKNKKAKELSVPIITEDDFINLFQ